MAETRYIIHCRRIRSLTAHPVISHDDGPPTRAPESPMLSGPMMSSMRVARISYHPEGCRDVQFPQIQAVMTGIRRILIESGGNLARLDARAGLLSQALGKASIRKRTADLSPRRVNMHSSDQFIARVEQRTGCMP